MRTTQVLVIVICLLAIIGLSNKPSPTHMNVVNPSTSSTPSTQPSSGIGTALSITQ